MSPIHIEKQAAQLTIQEQVYFLAATAHSFPRTLDRGFRSRTLPIPRLAYSTPARLVEKTNNRQKNLLPQHPFLIGAKLIERTRFLRRERGPQFQLGKIKIHLHDVTPSQQARSRRLKPDHPGPGLADP